MNDALQMRAPEQRDDENCASELYIVSYSMHAANSKKRAKFISGKCTVYESFNTLVYLVLLYCTVHFW